MSDTAALQSALAWAHMQPVTDGEGAQAAATASQLLRPPPLSLPDCRQTHSNTTATLLLTLLLPPPPSLHSPHAEYIVLELPARKFLLTQALHIRRSRLILRGQGSNNTTLVVPKSEWGNPRGRAAAGGSSRRQRQL